jgi:hypothetical protein
LKTMARLKLIWCAQLLELPHRIPSHETFRRVLSRLDADALVQCFLAWTQALSERSEGEIVAIDGKTLRRSFDRAAAKTAIPKLLGLLDLAGCVVTIDAMGGQKDIARAITEQNADDVLALKENPKTL